MKSAFFDCFYVMPPLKKRVHYSLKHTFIREKWRFSAFG